MTRGRRVKMEALSETGLDFEDEPREPAYIYLDQDKSADLERMKYTYPVEEPLREDDAEWVKKMFVALKTERYWVHDMMDRMWHEAKNTALQLSLARMGLRRERKKMQMTLDRLCSAVGPNRAKMIIDEIDNSMGELAEMERAKNGAMPQDVSQPQEDVQCPGQQEEQVQEEEATEDDEDEEIDQLDEESYL